MSPWVQLKQCFWWPQCPVTQELFAVVLASSVCVRTILTIIDCFSKTIHFVPLSKLPSPSASCLSDQRHSWKHHFWPESTVFGSVERILQGSGCYSRSLYDIPSSIQQPDRTIKMLVKFIHHIVPINLVISGNYRETPAKPSLPTWINNNHPAYRALQLLNLRCRVTGFSTWRIWRCMVRSSRPDSLKLHPGQHSHFGLLPWVPWYGNQAGHQGSFL